MQCPRFSRIGALGLRQLSYSTLPRLRGAFTASDATGGEGPSGTDHPDACCPLEACAPFRRRFEGCRSSPAAFEGDNPAVRRGGVWLWFLLLLSLLLPLVVVGDGCAVVMLVKSPGVDEGSMWSPIPLPLSCCEPFSEAFRSMNREHVAGRQGYF